MRCVRSIWENWFFEKIINLKIGFRINSMVNRLKNRSIGMKTSGPRGRIRSYNRVSDEKITKMMEVTFQQCTEAKIKWALNCYSDWCEMRLQDAVNFDVDILDANLHDTKNLSKANLEHALCRFICEVKKTKEDGDYPGKTLYQLVCALQNHLKKIGKNWKLVHGDEFQDFQHVLDKVMQERASMAVGTTPKQAQVISLEFENRLWNRGVLGEDSPEKLRSSALYLIGVNCALRAGDEHYALRRPGGCVSSQFSFEHDEMGL